MTITFFFSVTGSEMLFEEGRWKRGKQGHHLVAFLSPVLKALRQAADNTTTGDCREEYKRILDAAFPDDPLYDDPLYNSVRLRTPAGDPFLKYSPSFHDKDLKFQGLVKAVSSVVIWPYMRPPGTPLPPSKDLVYKEEPDRRYKFMPQAQMVWRGQGVDVFPEVLNGKLGFQCVAGELWKAAYIEAALMIMFNQRRISICPGCMGIHCHKQDSKQQDRLCEGCKKKRQQERNSKRKRKTDMDYTLNMISQAKRRGKLTEEQEEKLRGQCRKGQETLARMKYASLTGGGKSRRKKARASASPKT
jgi:hypothetical protein